MLAFEKISHHREIAFDASKRSEARRSVAYSMDLLIPGFYFWLGSFVLRLGGDTPDDEPYPYPGNINSFFGLAIVLPGYKLLSTYKSTYDPR